ncbi:MAG: hypothetical protein IKC33_03585 [Clostridia bacterium]|nr:hypothetical protein [Clostridia bacterium]
MYVDPSGHSAILIGLIIGAIVGAGVGVVVSWFVDDVLRLLKDGLLDLIFD